ncbi:MAG: hypothetical protein ACRC9W_10835, partial [Plesiomonas sp.]
AACASVIGNVLRLCGYLSTPPDTRILFWRNALSSFPLFLFSSFPLFLFSSFQFSVAQIGSTAKPLAQPSRSAHLFALHHHKKKCPLKMPAPSSRARRLSPTRLTH